MVGGTPGRIAGTIRDHLPALPFIAKWLLISCAIGAAAGTASAGFLASLSFVTALRQANPLIILGLPLAGFAVGLAYHRLGKDVEGGNNLLIDTIHEPGERVPFRMAPLIFAGTVITHLFGGSAGREGTGLQMAGAIADQFSAPFRLGRHDRRILMIAAISAGFGSVFGTPLAGAVFALEVYVVGRISYDAVFPAFAAGIIADFATRAWGVGHAGYHVALMPALSAPNFMYAIAAGIAFGLCAALFCALMDRAAALFRARIAFAPLRPLVGGIAVAGILLLPGMARYAGLGTDVIVDAFGAELPWYDFAAKTGLTALTLGSGFKGGEVTPLFFIGSTLGNALSGILPLPRDLLAAMGFAAVFAGASNTPLACVILGLELFGTGSGVYVAIACIVAYLVSGHRGIYRRQRIGQAKLPHLADHTGKTIHELR